MKRHAEAVLNGHPDRFCDLIADHMVQAVCHDEPDAYAQIEVSVWSDLILLTGGAVTRKGRRPPARDIIVELGRRIGYVAGNHIDVERYRVMDEVCHIQGDPREWTEHVNDQCIIKGWAGYDALTHFLPPEHFLVCRLREAVVSAIEEGPLHGEGPDGKLLVVMHEAADGWHPETVLLTLQHRSITPYTTLVAEATHVLREAWAQIQRNDPRWKPDWRGIRCLVNPNGPMHEGGSDADNGQTGRKTVMDFYGPRIPIGGGALHGKHRSHIDRLGAAEARRYAVDNVKAGATETLITLCYAPGMDAPISIDIQSDRPPHTPMEEFFHIQRMLENLRTDERHFGLTGHGMFYGI